MPGKSRSKLRGKTMAKTKEKITGEMSIGEVVSKHPKAAEVMMKHGMHCIGCHVALWESIDQGCQAHGMDKKTIKKMIDEMNEIA